MTASFGLPKLVLRLSEGFKLKPPSTKLHYKKFTQMRDFSHGDPGRDSNPRPTDL